MQALGQTFRLGIWSVKPENAVEFKQAWRISADWLAHNLDQEADAFLLEDTEDPSKFISFAPVSDPDEVEEVMSGDEFQHLWSDVMQLCNDVRPHTLRMVGSVSGKRGA